MTTVLLPEKASDLIELALKDLESVEKKPSLYAIDMSRSYHSPEIRDDESTEPYCSVCFAGAVMAETFRVPGLLDCYPDDVRFSTHNSLRLYALDLFRLGRIYEGLLKMHRLDPYAVSPTSVGVGQQIFAATVREGELLYRRHIVPYSLSKYSFKDDMRNLVSDLRKFGL